VTPLLVSSQMSARVMVSPSQVMSVESNPPVPNMPTTQISPTTMHTIHLATATLLP